MQPKFKIGDKVNVMYEYIDSYLTMEVKDVKRVGLIFKCYKYFVVNTTTRTAKWVSEDRLFKL